MKNNLERLHEFIKMLQAALGWQVKVEHSSLDRSNYVVVIKFHLRYKGGVWRDICNNPDYRATVLEMVKNKLYDLWDTETEAINTERAPTASKDGGRPVAVSQRTIGTRPLKPR